IPYIDSLPQLPPIGACQLKAKEHIARRAVALLIVIQFANDVAQGENIEESRDFFINMLHKYEVEANLTDNERAYLYDQQPNAQEAINISWQYEAYWILNILMGFVKD
uniref:DUF4272 domain-containing protein n=1 Tax=Lysinibacillus sp. D4B1_S16 TaxID=2941231 RepID=UPI0020C00A5F